MELLKDFTEDVNNQQMSIHAYTLYVTGLVGVLTNRIKELEDEVQSYVGDSTGEKCMKCLKCSSKNLTSSCFGGYYETLYCKDCKYSWSVD